MTTRLPVFLLLAPALALSAPPGSSDKTPPVSASLVWNREAGAVGCLSETALQAAVEVRLGRMVFVQPGGEDVRVIGSVAARGDGPGYVARLALHKKDGRLAGTREVKGAGARCGDLDGPLALVIALMVDLPREQIALSIPPPPLPPTVPAPDPASLHVADPGKSARVQLALGAGLVGAVGLLPGVGAGLRLRGRVAGSSLPAVELDATQWLSARADVAGRGAIFVAQQIGVWVCPLTSRRRRIEAGGCLGAEVGALTVVGAGLDLNQEATRPLLAAGARANVATRVGRSMRVSVGLGVSFPLVRETFFYEEGDGVRVKLHRSWPAIAFGDATFGWASHDN